MDHRVYDRLRALAAAVSEQIETIRRGHEAFNQGDVSWAQEFAAAEVEWGTSGVFPGLTGVYRGAGAVEQWMETLRAEWEEFEVSLVEVLDEKDDAIAIIERLWGRGRGSGAEAEMEIFAVYRFDAEGKITKRDGYTTRDEALAALRSSDK